MQEKHEIILLSRANYGLGREIAEYFVFFRWSITLLLT